MSPFVRRRLVAGLAGLLACAPAVAPSPASAAGGGYTYMLCANPDTGVGTTPQDGMFPDGVTMLPGHWNAMSLQADQRCAGQVNGGRG